MVYQKPRSRILSFKNAFAGIFTALKEEPNLKIHLSLALLATVMGFYFKITTTDWILIILLISMVIALELTNTAVEVIVDSFTIHDHPYAKKAKDVASGAVLTLSIAAALIGAIIFLPYLLTL